MNLDKIFLCEKLLSSFDFNKLNSKYEIAGSNSINNYLLKIDQSIILFYQIYFGEKFQEK